MGAAAASRPPFVAPERPSAWRPCGAGARRGFGARPPLQWGGGGSISEEEEKKTGPRSPFPSWESGILRLGDGWRVGREAP